MSKIGIIYGSSRPSKVGEHVAKWVSEKADFKNNEISLIDLAEEKLPLVPEYMPPMMVKDGDYETESIKKWSKKISECDAVIFIVAEYNLGYTPILKNSIDLLFHEWSAKPVAIVSYGSFPKSTAAEQLRTVMSPFKSDQVDESVHIAPAHEKVSKEGAVDDSDIVGDLDKLVSDLLQKI